jgi:hypothetical protein
VRRLAGGLLPEWLKNEQVPLIPILGPWRPSFLVLVSGHDFSRAVETAYKIRL